MIFLAVMVLFVLTGNMKYRDEEPFLILGFVEILIELAMFAHKFL